MAAKNIPYLAYPLARTVLKTYTWDAQNYGDTTVLWLGVMIGDSLTRGYEFESQRHILGTWATFVRKIVAQTFLKNSQIWSYCSSPTIY